MSTRVSYFTDLWFKVKISVCMSCNAGFGWLWRQRYGQHNCIIWVFDVTKKYIFDGSLHSVTLFYLNVSLACAFICNTSIGIGQFLSLIVQLWGAMLVAFPRQVHMLYLIERFQNDLICMRIVREGPTLVTFLFIFSWWGERGSICHFKRTIIGPPA